MHTILYLQIVYLYTGMAVVIIVGAEMELGVLMVVTEDVPGCEAGTIRHRIREPTC